MFLGEALSLGLIIPEVKHQHFQQGTRPLVPGAAGIEKHPVDDVTSVALSPAGYSSLTRLIVVKIESREMIT